MAQIVKLSPRPNTLNREYPTLRQILRYAEQRGYLPRGQTPLVTPELANANPRPAFMAGDFDVLQSESEKWIMTAESDDLRHKRQLLADWIYVNRFTGLRLPHEAALLKWTDINLSAALLYVSEHTKTGRREVPLRSEALTRLADMKARRKAYCDVHAQTFNETELVFVLVTGGAYGDLPKMFGKLISRCDFPVRAGQLPYTPYSLRHTYATFALAEGKDYPWLEEVMGTSMKMLREHYKQGTIEQTRRYLQERGLLAQQGAVDTPRIDRSVGTLELIDASSLPADHPFNQSLTLLPPKRK